MIKQAALLFPFPVFVSTAHAAMQFAEIIMVGNIRYDMHSYPLDRVIAENNWM